MFPEIMTIHHPISQPEKHGNSRGTMVGVAGAKRGFSLVEILITVALLSVIILGLVAMFNQVRRAFTSSITQVDMLESGRATMDMLTRELEQIIPANIPFGSKFYTINFFADVSYTPSVLALTDPKDLRTNVLEELFFLNHYNQQWSGIGYRVSTPNLGYGTLYKYTSNNVAPGNVPLTLMSFENTPISNMNRIADGVVHFRVLAYDANGVLITSGKPNGCPLLPYPASGAPNSVASVPYPLTFPDIYNYSFATSAVPAYLELELGILEARSAERLRSLGGNATLSQAFIASHVGQVHLFRQRISLRNVDPNAYK
jgi:prepilin-type N-terminal cleavage/methylation domain-containing protein